MIFKALWSIRNLSKNTQKTYSKHLRRLAKDVDLNMPVKVEEFIFNLECKNKTRNNYLMAYGHYCKANEIDWTNSKGTINLRVQTEIGLRMNCSLDTIRDWLNKLSSRGHIFRINDRPAEYALVRPIEEIESLMGGYEFLVNKEDSQKLINELREQGNQELARLDFSPIL